MRNGIAKIYANVGGQRPRTSGNDVNRSAKRSPALTGLVPSISAPSETPPGLPTHGLQQWSGSLVGGLGGWGFDLALLPGGMLNPAFERPGTSEFQSSRPAFCLNRPAGSSLQTFYGSSCSSRPTSGIRPNLLSSSSSRSLLSASGNQPISGTRHKSGKRPWSGARELLGELRVPVKRTHPVLGLAVYAREGASQRTGRRNRGIVREELLEHSEDGSAPAARDFWESEHELLDIRRRTAIMRKRTLELMERAEAAEVQYLEEFTLHSAQVPSMPTASCDPSVLPAAADGGVRSEVQGAPDPNGIAATVAPSTKAAARRPVKKIVPAATGCSPESPAVLPATTGCPALPALGSEDPVVAPKGSDHDKAEIPRGAHAANKRHSHVKEVTRTSIAPSSDHHKPEIPTGSHTTSKHAPHGKATTRTSIAAAGERGSDCSVAAPKKKNRMSQMGKRMSQMGTTDFKGPGLSARLDLHAPVEPLRREKHGRADPGEAKRHEMSTKFTIKGVEHLAQLCIYEHGSTNDLRIEVHLVMRGDVLEMHIAGGHVDDLLHHVKQMGGDETARPVSRQPSLEIEKGHEHRSFPRQSSKGSGAGVDDDTVTNPMEFLGRLVEVIREPHHGPPSSHHYKPDLHLQIVGWVNPTVRPVQEQEQVGADFAEAFQQFRAK